MLAPKKLLVHKALYFTDNGRIVCGDDAGMSAQYTGRDISGQKVIRVTAKAAASWLAEVGSQFNVRSVVASMRSRVTSGDKGPQDKVVITIVG